MKGGLTCLYGTAQVIYGKPYFFEDGIHYYRHREGEGSLSLSDGVPEGDRALDLRLTDAPAISGGSVHERRIEVGDISFDYRISQRLLDFYAGYPHTEMYVKAGAADEYPGDGSVCGVINAENGPLCLLA